PQLNALSLGTAVRDLAEIVGELRVAARLLRGEERDQRIMCRLGDRGFHGSAVGSGRKASVALVVARDGVYRLEDRDVDDRHRPARSPRPKLLAESPLLATSHRGMVEPTDIDGDFIPVVEPSDRVDPVPWWMSRHCMESRRGMVARP